VVLETLLRATIARPFEELAMVCEVPQSMSRMGLDAQPDAILCGGIGFHPLQ
jgi:hypothetical protein